MAGKCGETGVDGVWAIGGRVGAPWLAHKAMHEGVIVAEKRDPTLDHELEIAWLNLKVQGTRFTRAKAIDKRILGLNLRSKKENIAGLQLADLVVSPIGRHVLGKPDKEDWRIVEGKLRRDARDQR